MIKGLHCEKFGNIISNCDKNYRSEIHRMETER